MESVDVALVGAGISGLAAATRLAARGYSLRVYEAESQPGGNMRTERDGGYLLERGPHSFLGSSRAIWRLLRDTALLDSVQPATPAARYRYVYRDGRLNALPLGPLEAVSTKLLSGRAKLRLLAEPFLRGGATPSDTVHDFIARRFGKEAATYLAGPFVSGIYAGDPKMLGARDAFPTLWEMEARSGSVVRGALRLAFSKQGDAADRGPKRRGLFSFPAGLGDLTAALSARLGSAVRLSSPVAKIARDGAQWVIEPVGGGEAVRARAVIVATPPHRAAALLPAALSELLGAITLVPVVVVHIGKASGGDRVPAGFGCLIPRLYGIRTLGIVFVSQLFSGRAPSSGLLLTAFIGGALDAEAIQLPDDALVGQAIADFATVTGVRLEPDFTRVLRHTHAIPQLVVGHRDRIAQLEAGLTHWPGLFLAGNYLRGVGMNDAVASGEEAARQAASFIAGES